MEEHLKEMIDRVTLELGHPDVDFRAVSQSFKVHKKVLEKFSPVLKAKLSDVWQTSGDVLQLDEDYVEPEVVEELLMWLYSKHAGEHRPCSTENAYSLYIAAHYLMISELVTACCSKLVENIIPENIHDLFALSNHLSLDNLLHACVNSIVSMPSDFLLSPQVVKWTTKELEMFFKKLSKPYGSQKICDTILLSLVIWVQGSFEDRSRESERLLKFVPPEKLSSDVLFRFMETELYSKLDESHRKQYSIRSYLPPGISSTDKLYCISWKTCQPLCSWRSNVYCLDLSKNERCWLLWQQEGTYERIVLGVSWREKIYFFGAQTFEPIKVFSTKTDEWLDFKRPSNWNYDQRLAGVALNDYVYISESEERDLASRTVGRFSLKTKRWKALPRMQTARLEHQLVVLGGLIYAIGGEALSCSECFPKSTNKTFPNLKGENTEKKQLAGFLPLTLQRMFKFRTSERASGPSSPQCEFNRVPGPERYDPRTDRWKYIASSNYHHKLPAAVAHEGQIYVLSQAGFEAYSPKTDRWSVLPVPVVCCRPSLVSIAGRLWLLTNSSHSSKVRLVYEFDVVKQEWTRLPDLPEGDCIDFAFVIKQ